MELYLGDTRQSELPTFRIGHPYGRLVLCPICLRGSTLVGVSAGATLRFDEEDALPGYRDFRNVPLHMRRCQNRFPDGISTATDDEQHRIAEELSDWSRREARWDAPLFRRHMVEEGTVVYVSTDAGRVQGYGVFTTHRFDEVGERTYIEDLYTFPSYRRQGVAQRLIEHAMRNLPFPIDLIPVSHPVRMDAAGLVARLANHHQAQVMCVTRRGYRIVPVNEFEQDVARRHELR